MGPRLRHVRAEGTDCCWNPLCSPLIREFNCQTQTDAGLRRTSSTQKTLCEHAANLPSNGRAPRAPLFIHVSKSAQTNTKHIRFISDNCCVCDLLSSHLPPVKHWLDFRRVFVWQLPSVMPFTEFPVSSQSSVTFWTLGLLSREW